MYGRRHCVHSRCISRRSLWRSDFNRSRPSSGTLSALRRAAPNPNPRQRSFIRYTCIIAYGRFICLPVPPPRASARAPRHASDNIFPAWCFNPPAPSRRESRRSRVFSGSHVPLASLSLISLSPSPSCLTPRARAYVASLKGCFFSLVKPRKFRAAPWGKSRGGEENDQSAVPRGSRGGAQERFENRVKLNNFYGGVRGRRRSNLYRPK